MLTLMACLGAEEPLGRKDHVGRGAHARLAGQRQSRAVCIHQRLGERQPEARPGLPARGSVELVEGLHGIGDLVLAHADAAVAHPHAQLALHNRAGHDDLPTLFGELDGVGEKIEQDLLEPSRIGTTRGRSSASEVRSTMRERLASGSKLATQISTTSPTSTAVKSSSNLPASILEISSRSLSRLS